MQNNNKNNKKVLLFGINLIDLSGVSRIAGELNIDVINVPSTKWNESLGALAGVKGIPAQTSAKADRCTTSLPMLVMSGLSPDFMDKFTDTLKKAGVATTALKAVITPVNIFWTPAMLCEELSKEHKALNGH